jgi:eukaryotic-like serine/threonine-protein kinase
LIKVIAPEALRQFDPSELARVKEELAVYVGPVARILVERACKRTRSVHELYEALSVEVPAGEERKRFLAARPR